MSGLNPSLPPPWVLRPGFEMALANLAAAKATAIVVEKINGPVLLLSGTDDRMWA